jgi:hypothetical protein
MIPMTAFQPKWVSIYTRSQFQTLATIITGGDPNWINTPPTEILTNSKPSVVLHRAALSVEGHGAGLHHRNAKQIHVASSYTQTPATTSRHQLDATLSKGPVINVPRFAIQRNRTASSRFLLGHDSSLHLRQAINRRSMDIKRSRDIRDRFAF